MKLEPYRYRRPAAFATTFPLRLELLTYDLPRILSSVMEQYFVTW